MSRISDAIFNFDSPFMLKASRVACLILLNILWLVCCLPVITIGPATTAMYFVIFQYHTGRSDSVFRPFFRAFRRDFWQSLLLGLPLTVLWALLAFNGLYIYGLGDGLSPMWIPYFVMVIFASALTTFGFPMLARYQCRLRDVVNNSVAFLTKEPLASIRGMILVLMPVLLALFAPEFFLRTSFFWALIGFALMAWLHGKWVLELFEKREEN